jgi:hypothetical protein
VENADYSRNSQESGSDSEWYAVEIAGYYIIEVATVLKQYIIMNDVVLILGVHSGQLLMLLLGWLHQLDVRK